MLFPERADALLGFLSSHAQQDEISVSLVLPPDAFQMWQFLEARPAPGRKEVYNDHMPPQLFLTDGCAFECGQRERRSRQAAARQSSRALRMAGIQPGKINEKDQAIVPANCQ